MFIKSQVVRHVDLRVLQWFSARMSSHLLAALTGLSDSEPVCAAALINPTLCDSVSSSLFLPFLLFFPLEHFSNYSLTSHFLQLFHFFIIYICCQTHLLCYLCNTKGSILTPLFSKSAIQCTTYCDSYSGAMFDLRAVAERFSGDKDF